MLLESVYLSCCVHNVDNESVVLRPCHVCSKSKAISTTDVFRWMSFDPV